MYKLVITGLCLFLLSAATPSPMPIIKFRDHVPQPDFSSTGVMSNMPVAVIGPIYYHYTFLRKMGATQQEIISSPSDYPRNAAFYRSSVRKAGPAYELFVYDHLAQDWGNDNVPKPSNQVSSRAFYVMDKAAGQSVGYCLLETWPLYPPNDNLPDEEIRQLPVDSDFLAGKLQIPPGVNLTHYARRTQGYVERYTFLAYTDDDPEYGFTERMPLEGFYPESVEAKLEKPMIRYLQKKLNYYGLRARMGSEVPLDETLLNINELD